MPEQKKKAADVLIDLDERGRERTALGKLMARLSAGNPYLLWTGLVSDIAERARVMARTYAAHGPYNSRGWQGHSERHEDHWHELPGFPTREEFVRMRHDPGNMRRLMEDLELSLLDPDGYYAPQPWWRDGDEEEEER